MSRSRGRGGVESTGPLKQPPTPIAMKMRPFALAAAIALGIALASGALAEEKKAEGKTDKAKDTTYVVACDSPCDFTVKSHDKAEVVAVVKTHAKSHHNMDLADKDVEAMVKTHGPKS